MKRYIIQKQLIFVTIAHFLLILPFFSPFFLNGQNIFGSGDNTYAFFPHVSVNLQSLKTGDLNLWNPYILCGIDFTSSTHNYILSPFNWLLMLFPEKYFFTAFTIRVICELWLIGVFGFLVFNVFLKSQKWAFFASVIYQLGSLTVLGITVYPATTTLLLSTIAAYLLITLERRKLYLSYLFLTATLTAFFLSSQIVYVAYMMLSIILLYVYWNVISNMTIAKIIKQGGVFTLASLTAGLIGSLRVLPFYEALKNGARLYNDIGDLGTKNLMPFHYFPFIPETLSLNFYSSLPIAELIEHDRAHIHGTPSFYIGVIPILLIIWSLIGLKKWLPLKILSTSLLLIFLWIANVQPLASIFTIILYPFLHPASPLYLLPMGLALAAGYTGKYLEENPRRISQNSILLILLISFTIFVGASGIWIRIYPFLLTEIKIYFLFFSLSSVFLFLSLSSNHFLSKKQKSIIILLGANLLYLVLAPYLIVFHKFGVEIPLETESVFKINASYLGLTIVSLLCINLSLLLNKSKLNWILRLCIFGVLGTLSIASIAILMAPVSVVDPTTTLMQSLTLFMMGSLRFILGGFLFVIILFFLRNKILAPKFLFPLLLVAVLLDLLPFGKSYSRVIGEPFFAEGFSNPTQEEVLANIDIPVGYDNLASQNSNLLRNPKFQKRNEDSMIPAAWKFANAGSSKLLYSKNSDQNVASLLELSNDDELVSHLYQDIENPEQFAGKELTLGAWIKSSSSNYAKLLLADGTNASAFVAHSGSGQWEWIETHFTVQDPQWVRAHISLTGKGSAEIREAILTETPKDKLFALDLENYRLQKPHVALGLYSNPMDTNIPSYYGVRTYGGVNSQITKQYSTFVRNFDDREQQLQHTVSNIVENDRFLDLVGVRYELDNNNQISLRPNALARFMLFSNFEAIDDPEQTLTRLKQEEFNPNQTLLLARDVKMNISQTTQLARPVKATKQTASRIELDVDTSEPALLFFGDSYDRGWTVSVNGQEQDVIPANYQFMATAVWPGKSKVIFQFKPPTFMLAVKLAQLGLVLLGAVTLAFWGYPKLKNSQRKS